MAARQREPTDARRQLPPVDRLLAHGQVERWCAEFGRESVKVALRAALEEARAVLREGASPPAEERLLERAGALLHLASRPSLVPLLNGTGVILHTNFGRAPLSTVALRAVHETARGYSNLEYRLAEGSRGSRYDHCADLLVELTGSEAAVVVNNNAAAVALIVNELAHDRDVVVSRGELIEIGGSFRIPDVIARAGGRLVEVGTTNRTRAEDYRRALGPHTAMLLKVHPSNYTVQGFVSSVELEELVALGRAHGVPVVHDLGSGLLLPALLPGFPREPTPAESVTAGVDLVCWSGDKLLGGPQAGIVHGNRPMIDRLRRSPLLRAFRVDKMTLAALEATLMLYRNPERAAEQIPALAMLREAVESVQRRAREAMAYLEPAVRAKVSLRRLTSVVGGGAMPEFEIPSAGWAVRSDPVAVERRCRGAAPPLVGRIEAGEFRVDFRTLLPGEEMPAARALSEALRDPGTAGSPES